MAGPHHFAPRRELGRTGFVATLLGVGDVADRSVPPAECVATVRRAFDAGLNVVDTAPSYENGYSEEIVGEAVRGRREEVFLIDKVDHFDRPVRPLGEGSLARLKLPRADAFVFHGVSKLEDWEKLARPGGGMEELEACVRAGLARFRGISSHPPDVLRAALESSRCDVVLFPIGPHADRRYAEESLPLARRLGVCTVCFKTFGAGKLLADTSGYNRPLEVRPRGKRSSGGDDRAGEGGAGPRLPRLSVAECLRFTLTCDPDVALLGLSFPNEQDAAFAAAASFTPCTAAEMEEVRGRAASAILGKGPCWWNPGGS
jgi:aryl-alcohol dehydrogenase-like predicted oxidoreductase